MNRRGLSRRRWLRGALAGGAGVAVGLPLLDAMLRLGGTAHADGTGLPKRFAVWFWGNGTQHDAWAPRTLGAGWEPSTILSPLADVRDHVHVISGTVLPLSGRYNKHAEGAVGVLCGGNPVADSISGNDWDYLTVPNASVDEIAADHLGTPVHRSLVMAVTELHPVSGPGTAIRYTSHRGRGVYNPPSFDPAEVFARLFGGGMPATDGTGPSAEARARASVLDAVLEDARSLEARLGAADRTRLSLHLEAIRDLERRVLGASGEGSESCTVPGAPTRARSDRENARLMAELTAMAFACDLTRVASIEFSSPASHANYPDAFPGGEVGATFHEYEHTHGYDANVVRGFQYFTDLYGDFVRALLAVPEADGTLLDRSVVLGTSELANGQSHEETDFPLLVAGHAGLPAVGTHVRAEGANTARGPLTCLRALGWTGARWGSEQFETSDEIPGLITSA